MCSRKPGPRSSAAWRVSAYSIMGAGVNTARCNRMLQASSWLHLVALRSHGGQPSFRSHLHQNADQVRRTFSSMRGPPRASPDEAYLISRCQTSPF